MNDEQLISLLRMAAEADRISGTAARLPIVNDSVSSARMGSQAVFPRSSAATGAGVFARGGWTIGRISRLSAAAAVVIAACLIARSSSPRGQQVAHVRPSTTRPPTTHDGSSVVSPASDHAPFELVQGTTVPTRNMMMAVFSDECGERACVVTHDRESLDGRDPTKMSDEELLRLALGDRCTPIAERVVVIGLSGPDASLPRTDTEAEILAACLGTTPVLGRPSSAALACIPPGVSVVTATLSLGGK